jgi:hypothetical protein
MKILSAIILGLLSVSACADQEAGNNGDVREISFGGRTISLVSDTGHCALKRSDDSLLRLDVKWPCKFSKDLKGRALLKDYRASQIFMVQHTEPPLPPETDCRTDLQAIRYYKGKVELAPVSRVGACPPRQFDHKVFVWQFDW